MEVEEEKFCEYLWYAFFEAIKDAELKDDDGYGYNFINKFGIPNERLEWLSKKSGQDDEIAHIPQELDMRGIDHRHHIAHCFRAICHQKIEYENILPQSLQPKGVDLKQSLSTLVGNSRYLIRSDQCYTIKSANEEHASRYADDFMKIFAPFFKEFATDIKNRFHVDSIALFVKIYMQKEFIDKTIDSNLKEEDLTMTKLTLRIIEQKMQESNNIEGKTLKEVLATLFPPLKDEAKFQKACSFLHNDLRLSILNDKELCEHEFDIDSEYAAEIESSLDSIYTKSYNATQTLDSLFEKFEDILLKNDDYDTYSTEQKGIVDNLKIVYVSLGEALLKLNSMLEVKEELSPRARKRLYAKGINDMQEALDSIHRLNINHADTDMLQSQNSQVNPNTNANDGLAKSPSNPFMKQLD